MATYRPDPGAEWLAAVRGGLILVVPASSSGTLAELWPRLAEADPTPHVLDRLTAAGLAATPPFALVVRGADGADGVGARVVVRGPLSVRAGDTLVSGDGVSTWAERVLGSADVVVGVDAEMRADVAGESLPVIEAVVPATVVRSAGIEAAAPVDAPSSAHPEPPSIPSVAAEQTIVPVEETIAAPSTAARSLAAPVPVGAAAGGAFAAAEPVDGDHDGLTVASIDLRRLREQHAERAAADGPHSSAGAPSTAAVTNLRMPDGALEAIGHEVVLGRAPSVSQVSGVRLPRLVTIGAGDPDISRNHLRVGIEGGTVVVTDLHSRNGTHVVAPGKAPVKLRAGEPTPVLPGTVLDLGGGWTIQVVGD